MGVPARKEADFKVTARLDFAKDKGGVRGSQDYMLCLFLVFMSVYCGRWGICLVFWEKTGGRASLGNRIFLPGF